MSVKIPSTKPQTKKYLYTFLALFVITILVCGVSAAPEKDTIKVIGNETGIIKKIVEDNDKIVKPDIVVKYGHNIVDTKESKVNASKLKSIDKSVVKQKVADAATIPEGKVKVKSKSIKSVATQVADAEKTKAFETGQYIQDAVDLKGKATITSTEYNNVINITIYNQTYDPITGMVKVNLTATRDGKSLLIHNPVTFYGIPLTIQKEEQITRTIYPNISALSPKIVFANGSKLLDYEEFKKQKEITITETIYTDVEAPQEAIMLNLARAFETVEYGEPTFDGIDPTAIFYANGTWTVPVNIYSAKATIVGGGGGASGGYGGGVSVYTCDGACTCTIHHTNQVYGQGAGGYAAYNTTVNEVMVTPNSTWPVVIGGGGRGVMGRCG
jgi:hypothetical protein